LRKLLIPAALALSIVSMAAPATAVEGTLDGIVYALPDDSKFELHTMHLPEPDQLQARVDEIRDKVPSGSLLILFRSRPNSKDLPRTLSPTAPKVTPKLETVLTLFRDPAAVPDFRASIDKAIKDAVYRDGVAKLVVNKPGTDKPMFARSYAIKTGLGFAPEADAHCDDQPAGVRCFVDVARPGRLRLRWTSLILDETSPQAVRAHVRELIAKALPVEMEKEKKKTPARR